MNEWLTSIKENIAPLILVIFVSVLTSSQHTFIPNQLRLKVVGSSEY
jgi:hypothetical protein